MDILSLIRELYIDLSHNLPDHVLGFLVRTNLLLACSAALAFLGYTQGFRHPKAQASLMAAGVLTGLSIPIEFMLEPTVLRPWLLMLLVTGCTLLPVLLAINAHPHMGIQKKFLKYTYIGMAVLFILNLFLGG